MSIDACFKKNFTPLMLAPAYSVKISVIFGVRVERRKVDKKANLHKNRNMQTLLSSLLNISTKYHQNRSLEFWAIPFHIWCIFWDTV